MSLKLHLVAAGKFFAIQDFRYEVAVFQLDLLLNCCALQIPLSTRIPGTFLVPVLPWSLQQARKRIQILQNIVSILMNAIKSYLFALLLLLILRSFYLFMMHDSYYSETILLGS